MSIGRELHTCNFTVVVSAEDRRLRESAVRLTEYINGLLGWRAADPQFCRVHNRYTEGVILRRRGAEQLQCRLLVEHAVVIEATPAPIPGSVTALLRAA
jgi:hypothetical protein